MNSNLADIVSSLINSVDVFNCKLVRADESLGRNITNKIINRITERCVTENQRITIIWLDNSETPP